MTGTDSLPPLEAIDVPAIGDEVLYRLTDGARRPARVLHACAEGHLNLRIVLDELQTMHADHVRRGVDRGEWLTYADARAHAAAGQVAAELVTMTVTELHDKMLGAIAANHGELEKRILIYIAQLRLGASTESERMYGLAQERINGAADALRIIKGEISISLDDETRAT